jgi:hypothetical protein
MVSIKMFSSLKTNLKALTMIIIGKQYPYDGK